MGKGKDQIKPRKNQAKAEKSPVNKNQRMLPIVFIKISLNVLTIVVNFMLSHNFIFVNKKASLKINEAHF